MTTYAAIDLGSNSFHLIIAQDDDGHLQIIDRLRESVRLASGLDQNNNLTEESQLRALACLERFGQRLREIPISRVHAVGTNTLRMATNSKSFLRKAQKAIGHPIDIIAGVEEARLIYLGVSQSLPGSDEPYLVVDIGGGSTEIILGLNFEPTHMESTKMGCVSFSLRYFGDGIITRDRVNAALVAARLRLQPHKRRFKEIGWHQAVGASGTIKAISEIVQQMGWSNDGITYQSMQKLIDALVDAGHTDHLLEQLKGLKEERIPVICGGAVVLMGIFESLKIEQMMVSSWALREGLIYDMLGRSGEEDVRERTIKSLAERYQVDQRQSERVLNSAVEFFKQVQIDWELNSADNLCLLTWAARLYEMGLGLAHSSYHKHGYYLLEHADMPGFTKNRQHDLAALVRAHRGKFPKFAFKKIDKTRRTTLKRLAIILRLAAVLRRSRSDNVPSIGMSVNKKSIKLEIPQQWFEEHPLTEADLSIEAEYLADAGFDLKYK